MARRALLIAISYHSLANKWPKHELHLKGTHHDPSKIYDILTRVYGYEHDDITILMDDHSGRYQQPTRENMLREMEALVQDADSGDSFVFHFSGHGSQVRNLDGTEDDHYDEVIWPSDVQYNPEEDEESDVTNYIKDDDLMRIMAKPLPSGAQLTAIFDCCHSGTALDLPFSKDESGERYQDLNVQPKRSLSKAFLNLGFSAKGLIRRHVSGGHHAHVHHHGQRDGLTHHGTEAADVTSWAACSDSETTLESKRGGMLVSALHEELFKSAESNGVFTHEELLKALTYNLHQKTEHAKQHMMSRGMRVPEQSAHPQLGSIRRLDNGFLGKPFALVTPDEG